MWSCVLVSGNVGGGFRGIGALRLLVLLGVFQTWPCRVAASLMCQGVGLSRLLVLWMVLSAASRVVHC